MKNIARKTRRTAAGVRGQRLAALVPGLCGLGQPALAAQRPVCGGRCQCPEQQHRADHHRPERPAGKQLQRGADRRADGGLHRQPAPQRNMPCRRPTPGALVLLPDNNGVLILLVMETQQYADGDYYIDLQVTVSATPRWKVRPVPLPRPWRTTSSGRTMTTP